MRILHVINVRWFNATSWYALTLGKLMQEAGHETLIVTLKDTHTWRKSREWGLPTVAMDLNSSNPLRLASCLRRMTKTVSLWEPDIINCHRGESFFLWALLRAMGGRFKLVRTKGDQRLPRNTPTNRLLHGRMADAVVATNSVTGRYFHQALGVPQEKLWVIYGGVDRNIFQFDSSGREQVRQEFGFDETHTVVGLLGRFDRVKGQRETIEAVARLRREHGMEQVRLLLLGHDAVIRRTEVEQWIREFGVGDITTITGKREDVGACISAMDIGLVASLWSETIARAPLEIMACGRPLLSTRVGVMPDLLQEEALLPPGDPTAITALLGKALTDEHFVERITAEQQRRMVQLSHEEFLRHTIALYQSLME